MGLIYISTNIVSTQDYHHLEDYHHLGGYRHLDLCHHFGQTTRLDWWNAPFPCCTRTPLLKIQKYKYISWGSAGFLDSPTSYATLVQVSNCVTWWIFIFAPPSSFCWIFVPLRLHQKLIRKELHQLMDGPPTTDDDSFASYSVWQF